MAIIFTDFVQDPELKNELGHVYNGIVSLMVLIMILILLAKLFVSYKLQCKKCCNKRNKVASLAANQAVQGSNNNISMPTRLN